jgi:hypothetical protein
MNLLRYRLSKNATDFRNPALKLPEFCSAKPLARNPIAGVGENQAGRRMNRERFPTTGAGGGLRWVLPMADGYEVRSDVPPALVERAAAGLLVGAGLAAGRRS